MPTGQARMAACRCHLQSVLQRAVYASTDPFVVISTDRQERTTVKALIEVEVTIEVEHLYCPSEMSKLESG